MRYIKYYKLGHNGFKIVRGRKVRDTSRYSILKWVGPNPPRFYVNWKGKPKRLFRTLPWKNKKLIALLIMVVTFTSCKTEQKQCAYQELISQYEDSFYIYQDAFDPTMKEAWHYLQKYRETKDTAYADTSEHLYYSLVVFHKKQKQYVKIWHNLKNKCKNL